MVGWQGQGFILPLPEVRNRRVGQAKRAPPVGRLRDRLRHIDPLYERNKKRWILKGKPIQQERSIKTEK